MLPPFSRPNQRRPMTQHGSFSTDDTTMTTTATPPSSKSLRKSMLQSPQRDSPTTSGSSFLDKRRVPHPSQYQNRDDWYSVKALSVMVDECESRILNTTKCHHCRCRKITALIVACGFAAVMAVVGNMTLVAVIRQQTTEHRVSFRDEAVQLERFGEVPDNDTHGVGFTTTTTATTAGATQHQESTERNTTSARIVDTNDSVSLEAGSTVWLEPNTTHLETPLLPLQSSPTETHSIQPKPPSTQQPNKQESQQRQVVPLPPRNDDSVPQRRRRGPVPLPQPLPESLAVNATFSACLLIKDDNDILSEWIAYHYYALNLRHLIVAVDPFSSESPHALLELWRNLTDLNIREWSDADFMPPSFLETGRVPSEYLATETDFKSTTKSNLSANSILDISNHRYRQRVFLASCMKDMRAAGRTWVIHIDTDEYVVPSKLLRQRRPMDIPVPPMEQPGAVLQLIQFVTQKNSALVHYPCMSMLRVLFGSVESRSDLLNDGVPESFVASRFETLRWRYHALPHQTDLHGNPKVILDVRAIPERYFTSPESQVVYSIHRPVRDYCLKSTDAIYSNIRHQPIAVNHYLGSWERYAKRSDKRRSRDIYDSKAKLNRGKDDGYMRPWLQGFVNFMGPTVAHRLLT